MTIVLTSAFRHNGGIKVKREWGSSTVTQFFVKIDGVLQPEKVFGYGKTPGERKTYAKNKVQESLQAADKRI